MPRKGPSGQSPPPPHADLPAGYVIDRIACAVFFGAPLILSLLIACGGATGDDSAKADDSGTSDTTETGETTDTETTPACETINPGEDWAWTGDCPQMRTPVVIAVDGCDLALDYEPVGGMTMGMPYSGTVAGDVVTFANDNSVRGCEGTVISADKIEGSCNGGCTYTLKR